MVIKIDGLVYKQMVISGANNLYNNKNLIDALNVYPVPDGDTGTNMSKTIMAASEALIADEANIGIVSENVAYALLRGARGNSGVILSQIFRGIAKSFKNLKEADTKAFANALSEATITAYKAVMKPTEGTILTVIREASKMGQDICEKESDFVLFFERLLNYGNEVLDKTTDMLASLKSAGVVDAGGKGLMIFLEGAAYYLKENKIISLKDNIMEPQKNVAKPLAKPDNSIKFAYCTEFIIKLKSKKQSIKAFKKSIENLGDSLVLIDEKGIAKLHIHTNNPGIVLENAIRIGTLSNIKIDNMLEQANTLDIKKQKSEKDKPKKDTGFIAVSTGDGLNQIFTDLGVDFIIPGGQTMNPSTDDILNAIEEIEAERIFIFPNNKNIILSAEQAKNLTKKKVFVVPTKSITAGISCMLNMDTTKKPQDIFDSMIKNLSNIKSGFITFAARDSEINEKTIKKGDILGLTDDGIEEIGTSFDDICLKILGKIVSDNSTLISVFYGEDIKEETAQALKDEISEKFKNCDVEVYYGGQPLYYYLISVE